MFGTIQASSERPTAAVIPLSPISCGRCRNPCAPYADWNAIPKPFTLLRPRARACNRRPSLCRASRSRILSFYQCFAPALTSAAKNNRVRVRDFSAFITVLAPALTGAAKNNRVRARDFSAFITVLAPALTGAARNNRVRVPRFLSFYQCFSSSSHRAAKNSRVGARDFSAFINVLGRPDQPACPCHSTYPWSQYRSAIAATNHLVASFHLETVRP
jgi:hypothetical protein